MLTAPSVPLVLTATENVSQSGAAYIIVRSTVVVRENNCMKTVVCLLSASLRYMDEHGIDVHCLVPLPWLECEPALHADEAKALEVPRNSMIHLTLLVAYVF